MPNVHNFGFGNIQYSGYTGASPAPFAQLAHGHYPDYYFILSGEKIRIFPIFPHWYGQTGTGSFVPFT